MKKISLILCIICLFTMCAMPTFAADYKIGVEVTNVSEDVITVSGDAGVDALVSILILNPGKSEADLDGGTTQDTAVQYFGVALSKGGKFSADVKMNTENGGVFTVIVKVGENKYQDTFSFYPYEKKLGDVEELTSDDKNALAEKLPAILENYGYSKHPLYGEITDAELAKEITSQNQDYKLETPEDADVFLRKMLTLAAFNSDAEALCASGKIDYAFEIGLIGNDWYKDYQDGILSDKGYEKLHADWIAKSYDSIEDIAEEFEELMCFYAIAHNALSGGGHVESLLEKYEEQYEDAGFKLSLIDDASGKKQLFAKLVAANTASLSDMANKFNSLFKKKTTTSDGGSSGGAPVSGGGGGAYIAQSGSNTTPAPSTPQTPATPQAPAYPFGDMESVSWAKDAVKALYDDGVVSGRGEGVFAPSDKVTRAEFAKMVLALVKDNAETQKEGIIKVACIGDSLTQGYVGEDGKYQTGASYTDVLQSLLGDGYEVKNFGIAAYGIYSEHEYSYTKTQQYQDSLAYEPDVVISVFGSNDMRSVYWDVIKADYVNIYKEFINTYKNLASNPEIIIGLPGPVYEGEYIASRPVENQKEVQAAILKAAEELGAKVADTYKALSDLGNDALPDGIHFNENGASVFANTIAKAVTAKEEKAEITFSDVAENAWFAEFVYSAAEKGLVNGYGDTFKPNDYITREDASLIVFRALSLSEGAEVTFTDFAQVADYAKGAVAALSAAKIINGVGDGSFAPKANLTRAQSAVLIYNALGGAAK